MGNWRVTLVVGALLSAFASSDAYACDVSGWSIEPNEGGECLERSWKGDNPVIKNVCAETIEVSVVDCTGACPDDLELEPDEEAAIVLADNAGRDDGFRLVSNMNDNITFRYRLNECPSEEGCNLGAASSRSSGWLGVLLAAGWLARAPPAPSLTAPRFLAARDQRGKKRRTLASTLGMAW